MGRKHRRLGIWNALGVYMGGKRKLCPLIFRELDRLLPRRVWSELLFLDGFLGGGSVSLYAKAQGFRVVATDIAERAIVTGSAIISNNRVLLSREDVLRLLEPNDAHPGRIETDFAPETFTRPQARFFDRALAQADAASDAHKRALIRFLAVRVALQCHAMGQPRSGTIHRLQTGEFESITESCVRTYVDGLRIARPDKLWELAQRINGGVFYGSAEVRKASVLDVLPEVKADVTYLDPPYKNSAAYESEYKVIDLMLEGEARPTSPFTKRTGMDLLDGLFERAEHIPVWILSYGNVGAEIEDLATKMKRFGRTTRSIELKYQHMPAVATAEKKERNRELLVIGWDPSSPLLKEHARHMEVTS